MKPANASSVGAEPADQPGIADPAGAPSAKLPSGCASRPADVLGVEAEGVLRGAGVDEESLTELTNRSRKQATLGEGAYGRVELRALDGRIVAVKRPTEGDVAQGMRVLRLFRAHPHENLLAVDFYAGMF